MKVQAKVSFEIELSIEATFEPGRPETPPAYAHGGLPAEPCQIEAQKITKAEINGQVLDLSITAKNNLLSAILAHEKLSEAIDDAVVEDAETE